jgi:Tfp pilus assembly protein FimV
MKKKLVIILITLTFCQNSLAESKRVEVYSVSQNYWDTQYGETLGEIALQLLPNNPRMQQRLMQDIVALNPQAFPDSEPNKMQANTRLWLPGQTTQADTAVNKSRTHVESFAWGNIKRPIR